MGGDSKRRYSRYLCRIAVRVQVPGARPPVELELRDVGMGGGLLHGRERLAAGPVEVHFPCAGGTANIRSRIVRRDEDPAEPGAWIYGVEFDPHFSERHKLLELVDRVRRGG
ncbi:MAG: hypothetical protein A2X36_01225 [Elusimicrobia bacterium GWA2_69_24]|nr:MAG: hypothetical protein A2X36_01225 [Elusimicrobia bacterium GWA2_69_24]HBL16486.1 hypothetical protein [Elusimicrobiota bacterium]